MHWRKNGAQLSKRKAIRDEARRRLYANRNDPNAAQVFAWAHGKIRRFYDIAPLSVVWPTTKRISR